MTELPEVETFKRVLEPQLVRYRITEVNVIDLDIVAYPSKDIFFDAIAESSITGMECKRKFLMINLSNGRTIILHSCMIG